MAHKLTNEQCYDIFFTVRNNFNTSHEAAYTGALKSTDAFIRNIALYLAENYNDAKAHCSLCDNSADTCTKLCKYLNKWLDEKKALYTCHGKCTYNKKIWDQYIESLWINLKGSEVQKEWCPRNDSVSSYNFPNDKIPDSCNNDKPTEFTIICNGAEDDDHYVLAPSTRCSSVSTFSLAMGYVLFCILLISILLYKFSPLGICLKNIIKGKIIRENIDEDQNDELYRNVENDMVSSINRRFNVVYNSVRDQIY
ncbi:PIR protein [Plasmodium ovale]|uniref:PIR protein n=1 Tax=Plasmodium ovale TaxID=36330 RepID=A0A1C3KHW6_PLAOA|nr:PIR protein [Plasmodium ovale]